MPTIFDAPVTKSFDNDPVPQPTVEHRLAFLTPTKSTNKRYAHPQTISFSDFKH